MKGIPQPGHAAAQLRLALVITAGGTGQRMAGAIPKQFISLAGQPVLARTLAGALQALAALPWVQVDAVVLSHPAEAEEPSRACLDQARDLAATLALNPACRWLLVTGGPSRQDSVRLALEGLELDPGAAALDAVLVHDGVRPLASAELYRRLLVALRERPDALGSLPLVPVVDTLKQVDSAGTDLRVSGTVDRDGLRAVQTPQCLRWPDVLQLHRAAAQRELVVTDEAMLAESLRPEALLLGVEGEARNLKLTRPEDLVLAQAWLNDPGAEDKMSQWRVGQGYDVHAFAPNRPLVLGGVSIPHPQGLAGHSDADVLLHAIADALLGAAALGDLGAHFPDTEERWRGADSWLLLQEVGNRVRAAGWMPANVDATVIGEEPRVRPHVDAMRQRIAQALGLDVQAVNVKGTTTEKLGFTGRREGLAAQAVVLLQRA